MLFARSASSAEMSIGLRWLCDEGCGLAVLSPSVMLDWAMRAGMGVIGGLEDGSSSRVSRSASRASSSSSD